MNFSPFLPRGATCRHFPALPFAREMSPCFEHGRSSFPRQPEFVESPFPVLARTQAPEWLQSRRKAFHRILLIPKWYAKSDDIQSTERVVANLSLGWHWKILPNSGSSFGGGLCVWCAVARTFASGHWSCCGVPKKFAEISLRSFLFLANSCVGLGRFRQSQDCEGCVCGCFGVNVCVRVQQMWIATNQPRRRLFAVEYGFAYSGRDVRCEVLELVRD